MKARESTDEDRDRNGLNTSGTTWTTVTTGTDCRWQMTMTMTAKHSQVVSSRGTEHSLHESVTCRQIGQISVCFDAGVLCDGKADRARHGTREEHRTILRRVVSWRRTRTLAGAATGPLEDLCRLGSS